MKDTYLLVDSTDFVVVINVDEETECDCTRKKQNINVSR
jgi:hypothetical protein